MDTQSWRSFELVGADSRVIDDFDEEQLKTFQKVCVGRGDFDDRIDKEQRRVFLNVLFDMISRSGKTVSVLDSLSDKIVRMINPSRSISQSLPFSRYLSRIRGSEVYLMLFILRQPFDRLPLYISDPCSSVVAITLWRLEHGIL